MVVRGWEGREGMEHRGNGQVLDVWRINLVNCKIIENFCCCCPVKPQDTSNWLQTNQTLKSILLWNSWQRTDWINNIINNSLGLRYVTFLFFLMRRQMNRVWCIGLARKFLWGFSVRSDRKPQTNFLANPIRLTATWMCLRGCGVMQTVVLKI